MNRVDALLSPSPLVLPSLAPSLSPSLSPSPAHLALPHLPPTHQRALRARGAVMPPGGTPTDVILDSWARCADAGLMAHQKLVVPVVEAMQLAHRRQRADVLRRLAQAELETLSRQIAGSNFLLAFADCDGVILDLYADNRFDMSGADAGIAAGSVWSETVAGTNGLGTALATQAPVAVTGLEHYFVQLGEVSCTAVPVRDAQGQVVGVLDASSYCQSRQRHTLALVQMAATHMENGLLTHQMQGQLVLALHPRPEFLNTLSAGLLAFDGNGCLVAINGPARSLLSGLQAQLGSSFEELFAEPMEHVLARLHRGGDVRLRDSLGSTLAARAVGQPLRNHTSAAVSAKAAPTVAAAAKTAATQPAPNAAPSPAPKTAPSLLAPDFLANDPAVLEACRLVQAAVKLRVPVLLHGETGTGKELLARHAHRCSGRAGEFVAVNCAAMPADLFEAELFGYGPGAFTGARREGNGGLIMAADGGTLLLDEVRELPLQLQAALLRFLDDQVVRPVGSHTGRRVDVQLLAASHADLALEVAAGRFRADLLYRLNTVRVGLPPLRQRQDLAQAAAWVLQGIDPSATLHADALPCLAQQSWPGNFRELRAVLTQALLARPTSDHAQALTAADLLAVLPTSVSSGSSSSSGSGSSSSSSSSSESSQADTPPADGSALRRSAGELVRSEFERSGRSVSQTSRALGVSRTTVYRHLRGGC
jgi:sigma-54 dependent transcriptional regulator, acetoin dehydrogenase operon transcriptional activator AcoR